KRIGFDGGFPLVFADSWNVGSGTCDDLRPTLRGMRRTKDPDEIELLQLAIRATEAAYFAAQENLRPGISELQLFARMRAAAVETVGEEIGEFGNDFQFGSPGGPPRRHQAQRGEVAV